MGQMSTQPPLRPTPPAPGRVRVIISAEMNNATGIKAVFVMGGVIFTSLSPQDNAEALHINQVLQSLS